MYVLLILIIIILLYFFINKKEKFTNLSNDTKHKIINSILENKNHIINNKLEFLRNKYDWIDPIIYEDIKQLNRNNKLNKENLLNKLFK